MARLLHHLSVGIHHVKCQTAELCALSPIGRTTETILRGIAQATIADAQGTMDKHLQFDIRHGTVNLAYLVNGEFSRQHYPTETERLKPPHLVSSAVVGLCTGMALHRQSAKHIEHRHILDKHGIHSGIGKRGEQAAGGIKLIIINDGVDRDIHPGTERVGISAQLGYVVNRIACRSTGTEPIGTDIHGIRTMVDGSLATFQVAGRSKEFKWSCHYCIFVIS